MLIIQSPACNLPVLSAMVTIKERLAPGVVVKQHEVMRRRRVCASMGY